MEEKNYGGTHGVMVIIIGNGTNDPNAGQGCLHLTYRVNTLGKNMNPTVYKQ